MKFQKTFQNGFFFIFLWETDKLPNLFEFFQKVEQILKILWV